MRKLNLHCNRQRNSKLSCPFFSAPYSETFISHSSTIVLPFICFRGALFQQTQNIGQPVVTIIHKRVSWSCIQQWHSKKNTKTMCTTPNEEQNTMRNQEHNNQLHWLTKEKSTRNSLNSINAISRVSTNFFLKIISNSKIFNQSRN